MTRGPEAPVAVPVEIRAEGRRVFRLSRRIGEAALRLGRVERLGLPAPLPTV